MSDQPPAGELQPPAGSAPARQASAYNPRRRARAPLPGRIRLQDRTEHRGCGLGERREGCFTPSYPTRRRLHSPLRPRETLALPPGGASTVPGPSAQARGGDACFKPPKTSAWEKGRLSSTQFPSPRPRRVLPRVGGKTSGSTPPPARICGPSLALLPTAWHRQGCLSPEVYRGRGTRYR